MATGDGLTGSVTSNCSLVKLRAHKTLDTEPEPFVCMYNHVLPLLYRYKRPARSAILLIEMSETELIKDQDMENFDDFSSGEEDLLDREMLPAQNKPSEETLHCKN